MKKSMQTALYSKIKERKDELLIGASSQNLLYLSIVATQHKTRQRRVRRVWRVLIIGKTRRHVGAQAREARTNYG